MSVTINCVNCGKQNILLPDDLYDVKCEYGEHPVRIKVKKEDKMIPGYSKAIADGGARKLDAEIMPVPPRPNLAGEKHGNIGRVMNKYYEANAPAILADRAVLGDPEACRRWGFSNCGYKNFLKRRGLTYVGTGKGKRREKGAAAPAAEKPPAPESEKDKRSKPEATAAGQGNLPAAVAGAKKIKIYILPSFPAFDNSWSFIVQEKWLETYAKLAGK